ncbi:hypothetical protein IE81DRAFT_169590 [Ceraceosorus guamensis]|uniref:Uncharacterized protein n=1 Tax=Ceraceosorus guamensis TaxID=1522189 RepID=A0A316VVF7_9BASI|nr:hypothetical protein IE81DRAFT_169590 [Ceraceosorus guamensis]PWN41627.1 hypothetical protein IE81DRAFT_169590 [Ceraceosorus guamensis]
MTELPGEDNVSGERRAVIRAHVRGQGARVDMELVKAHAYLGEAGAGAWPSQNALDLRSCPTLRSSMLTPPLSFHCPIAVRTAGSSWLTKSGKRETSRLPSLRNNSRLSSLKCCSIIVNNRCHDNQIRW